MLVRYHEKENKKSKTAPDLLLKVYFDNKGFEIIFLNRLLRQQSINMKLPKENSDDDRLMIVCKLCPTIRAKIQTVQDLHVDEWIENQKTCECRSSKFKDNHHNHIITGDLSIIENENLRKLLHKGPNYREKILLDMLNYLLDSIYFTFGNTVFRQTIGIPMGTDHASFVGQSLFVLL